MYLESIKTIVLASILIITNSLLHFEGQYPDSIGIHQGQLFECNSMNHCTKKTKSVTNINKSFKHILKEVNSLPRTVVISYRGNYAHFKISSAFFGFVDDLEIYADTRNDFIQIRSESRTGKLDFGVNRRRVEKLIAELEDKII